MRVKVKTMEVGHQSSPTPTKGRAQPTRLHMVSSQASVMKPKGGHNVLGAESPLLFTSYTWNAVVTGETHYHVLHPPSPLHIQEFKGE